MQPYCPKCDSGYILKQSSHEQGLIAERYICVDCGFSSEILQDFKQGSTTLTSKRRKPVGVFVCTFCGQQYYIVSLRGQSRDEVKNQTSCRKCRKPFSMSNLRWRLRRIFKG